jgi:hypothetical protein
MPALDQFDALVPELPPASAVQEAYQRARAEAKKRAALEKSVLRQQLGFGLRDIADQMAGRGAAFTSAYGEARGRLASQAAQQQAGIGLSLEERLAQIARGRTAALGTPVVEL